MARLNEPRRPEPVPEGRYSPGDPGAKRRIHRIIEIRQRALRSDDPEAFTVRDLLAGLLLKLALNPHCPESELLRVVVQTDDPQRFRAGAHGKHDRIVIEAHDGEDKTRTSIRAKRLNRKYRALVRKCDPTYEDLRFPATPRSTRRRSDVDIEALVEDAIVLIGTSRPSLVFDDPRVTELSRSARAAEPALA